MWRRFWTASGDFSRNSCGSWLKILGSDFPVTSKDGKVRLELGAHAVAAAAAPGWPSSGSASWTRVACW